ncbi:DUF4440 domain-containing protein [Rhodococcus sp. SORGH_AS_0303]|uniref:DUF4440 domain-containing protein n=1 Tax=Rhodococcus sp. SORGH_AS_0303 TaxID=3041753 RepID=UPI00278549F3|nr:DUF4440 domain-containing protein [Rhodococcus sp. SORGH_AS_0303]MDQ1200751.1 hypothetical protein [Rhodococcus sp. SORGH_AS_0303]
MRTKTVVRATSVAAVASVAIVLAACGTGQASTPAAADTDTAAGTNASAHAVGELTLDRIEDQFDTWLDTVAQGDPQAINALYREDAVLLPTLWAGVYNSSDERLAYFTDFVTKKPTGEIDESVPQLLSPTSGSLSGLYTFTMGESGDKVPARFTFVFELEDDGDVVIVDHHSSKLPA